jgi:7-cyano-7-deazaguanosine (preQ0) biosynthesis protein QueE
MSTGGAPVAEQMRLRVAELFGPTVQGEGPSVGQRAVFIRLSGCNLDCSWCDTPSTWDWNRFDQTEQSQDMSAAAVLDWVLAHDADLVVITGGEPLIQQRKLLPLVTGITASACRVEIETNGTIAPDTALVEQVARFNVSAKLANSGVPVERRIRPVALRAFVHSGKAAFKFVVVDADDVAELVELQARHSLAPVWVMPEGVTTQVVLAGLRSIIGPALQHGWNVTPRLHILLWENERGR